MLRTIRLDPSGRSCRWGFRRGLRHSRLSVRPAARGAVACWEEGV